MILRKVHLKNIRSYREETVELPEGTTLLAGDIGAGKSTVLHAVEFALFGILRGTLSGETLLRNGHNEGSVSLEMEVDGRTISIERTLKRTKQGVSQEAGSMTIDGVRQPLTATELKSRMLEILGYPADLLTKSKGLVYRYTVYTPQEDMKRIIFDEPEIRLNTLRRVFDIDKYKRIEENARILSRTLRERCRINEGRIADLPSKQESLKSKKDQSKETARLAEQARQELESRKKETCQSAKALAAHEEGIRRLNELRQKFAVRENEQRMLSQQKVKTASEIESAARSLSGIEQAIQAASARPDKVNAADLPAISQSISAAEDELRALERSAQSTMQQIGMARSRAKQCKDLAERIGMMQSCPTCMQPVADSHKSMILTNEQENLSKHMKEAEALLAAAQELENRKSDTQKRIEGLRHEQRAMIEAQSRMAHLKETAARIESLKAQAGETDRRLAEATAIKNELSKLMFPLENSEHAMKQAKDAHAKAQQSEQEAAVALTRLAARTEELEKQAGEIEQEIRERMAFRENLLRDKKTLDWMEDWFLRMTGLMERQVMATVHHHFNEAFTDWFNTLIDDHLMTARLDEGFTPLVTQNGYDISPEHLSGGEKTSLALAYRLALNKVINGLHSSIKTRDLIILDEPTDGFSGEQLDRVRDVMKQLPVRQCILVSHETKVESFVDRVITIEKRGHESAVKA